MPVIPYDTKAVWARQVAFVGGVPVQGVAANPNPYLAELFAASAAAGRPWRVLKGPRSNPWIEQFAPLIVIDWLREEEEEEAAQRTTWRYKHYYQMTIATLGATPEEADDAALDVSDAINAAWKGNGCYFGAEDLRVAGSLFTPSGWDVEQRRNPRVSMLVKNLTVLMR